MRIVVKNKVIVFEIIELIVQTRNIENIFKENDKTLLEKLDKAIFNKKNRLHKIAKQQKEKYKDFHNIKFGNFLLELKNSSNADYLLYLNKHGDKKYCYYRLEKFQKEKGIYCYVVDGKIVYIARSKKTFQERFNDYGRITSYNCLKDAQSTNCNINSRVNEIDKISAGFYLMSDETDEQIIILEKQIINRLKKENNLWNVQGN